MRHGNRGGWYGGRRPMCGEEIRGENQEESEDQIYCFDETMGIWSFAWVP